MIDPMRPTSLPFLQVYVDRHGRQRIYYRRQGKRVALRGPLGSADFHADYAAAHAAMASPDKPQPVARVADDSFAALIRAYKASPEFAAKAKTTRAEYARVLRVIEAEDGHRRPRDMRRKDVRKRRDARAATPAAANTYLGILSLLLGWAVETDWDEALTINVCVGISKFASGSYRPWTDDEKRAFEARWPLGSKQRLAYALARYTGQRRSDLVAMTRGQLAEGGIAMRQQKTGTQLWIPLHRALRAAIEAMPAADCQHLTFLTNVDGKPFNAVYFGAWVAQAIAAAGLPEDCVLHGLRHSAATDLAEAGCSTEMIRAVTGHRSMAMVENYTRRADQKRLARSAMTMLEQSDRHRKKS